MAQIGLKRPSIDSVIRELEAACVPKHVRMNRETEIGRAACGSESAGYLGTSPELQQVHPWDILSLSIFNSAPLDI